MEQTKKKKFQMPSAYTVLFIIIAVIAVLTWFIPAGHYSVDDAGNIVAGSYERVQQNPQGLWDIFMAPINGMLGVPAGELTKETPAAIPISFLDHMNEYNKILKGCGIFSWRQSMGC